MNSAGASFLDAENVTPPSEMKLAAMSMDAAVTDKTNAMLDCGSDCVDRPSRDN